MQPSSPAPAPVRAPRSHALRGRPSNRRLPEALREAVLQLYREQQALPGFCTGDLLREVERRWPGQVSATTLRRWRKAEGLRRPLHRRRRHAQVPGERVQLMRIALPDARHLLLIVDAATARLVAAAAVSASESSEDAWLGLFARLCITHGIPERCMGRPEELPARRRFTRLLSQLGVAWRLVHGERFGAIPAETRESISQLLVALATTSVLSRGTTREVIDAALARQHAPPATEVAWVRASVQEIEQALAAVS